MAGGAGDRRAGGDAGMLGRKSAEGRHSERDHRAQEKQQEKECLAAERAAAKEAAAREREQRARERTQRARERSKRREATTGLQWLGVTIRDGQVYKHSLGMEFGRDASNPPLGPLAGAQAEVVGGQAGRRRSRGARTADALLAASVLGPVGLAAGLSRKGTKGTAFVVFADGRLHEHAINDQMALVRAQADAVRFNALAAGAGATASEPVPSREEIQEIASRLNADPVLRDIILPPPPAHADDAAPESAQIAGQLAKLADLQAVGSITSAEFHAAKQKLLGL
jgi:hypothetical protein